MDSPIVATDGNNEVRNVRRVVVGGSSRANIQSKCDPPSWVSCRRTTNRRAGRCGLGTRWFILDRIARCTESLAPAEVWNIGGYDGFQFGMES